MNNLLLLFIGLSIINVIIQTVKSLCTVKAGKTVASLVNAFAYGFYTIILVYMNCDLTLTQKVVVTFVTNLIGVYIVKWLEEKNQKDKLWKIEFTATADKLNGIIEELSQKDLSFNYIDGVGKYTIFNVFCATQTESHNTREVIKKYDVKYFVAESKTL